MRGVMIRETTSADVNRKSKFALLTFGSDSRTIKISTKKAGRAYATTPAPVNTEGKSMFNSFNSTATSHETQPQVDYALVHNTFIRLVLAAGRRHDKRPWLALLVAALSPLDDAAKYANLKRIENEMEARRD